MYCAAITISVSFLAQMKGNRQSQFCPYLFLSSSWVRRTLHMFCLILSYSPCLKVVCRFRKYLPSGVSEPIFLDADTYCPLHVRTTLWLCQTHSFVLVVQLSSSLIRTRRTPLLLLSQFLSSSAPRSLCRPRFKKNIYSKLSSLTLV